MTMVIVRLAGAIVVATGLLGCIRIIADTSNTFVVEAEVVSEAGAPIEVARCYFVDRALDDSRRGNFESPVIGRSDRSGRLSATYEYFWGFRARGDRMPVRPHRDRWFSIVIRADGYQEVETRVDYRSLDVRSDGSVDIALGTIVLTPTLDAQSRPWSGLVMVAAPTWRNWALRRYLDKLSPDNNT